MYLVCKLLELIFFGKLGSDVLFGGSSSIWVQSAVQSKLPTPIEHFNTRGMESDIGVEVWYLLKAR